MTLCDMLGGFLLLNPGSPHWLLLQHRLSTTKCADQHCLYLQRPSIQLCMTLYGMPGESLLLSPGNLHLLLQQILPVAKPSKKWCQRSQDLCTMPFETCMGVDQTATVLLSPCCIFTMPHCNHQLGSLAPEEASGANPATVEATHTRRQVT